MKINTLKFFTLAFLLIFTSPAFAQKFGYLNSQALLSELPEVKQADANLQALQAQLEKKGQQMVSELENKYKDLTYIFDSSAGILLYAQESMDVTTLVKTKLGI